MATFFSKKVFSPAVDVDLLREHSDLSWGSSTHKGPAASCLASYFVAKADIFAAAFLQQRIYVKSFLDTNKTFRHLWMEPKAGL